MKTAAPIRYRVSVAFRILAAGLGGYALSAALAYGLARILPMSRSEAVMGATLIAMLAMPAAAVWAFAVRRVWQACAGIAALTLLAGTAGWLAGPPA